MSSGPPGTKVTITGSGFPAGEIVALYIDSPNPGFLGQPGPTADTAGAFRQGVTMPGKNYDPSGLVDPSKPGPHQICADTGYPGSTQQIEVKACATFNVEPGPSPTPTPQNPPAVPASPGLPVPAIIAAFVVLAGLVLAVLLLTRKSP